MSEGQRPPWEHRHIAEREKPTELDPNEEDPAMRQPLPIMQQHRTRQTKLGNKRVSRQEPSNHTRTCNKLPDVYM